MLVGFYSGFIGLISLFLLSAYLECTRGHIVLFFGGYL